MEINILHCMLHNRKGSQTLKGQMGTNGIDFAKSEKEGKSTKVAFAAGVERGERLGRKIPPAPCKIIF